ncbi:MAG: SH3 domain-containing protein [Myxococcota bacterium]
MAPTPTLRRTTLTATLLCSLSVAGCANLPLGGPQRDAECAADVVAVERAQAELFRKAETDRAEQLEREIERLQADLKTAESALVEVESGLTGSSGRADAVSSLAVTRIQVERAASRAPWRATEIAGAREKLEEAERQVDEGRFGAALFFVYRARRVAEGVLDEVAQIVGSGNARLIKATRVNLRSGPSTGQRVLAVLTSGTPVIPQATEGEWTLVQVTGGPAGWIHGSLLGDHVSDGSVPAAPKP